MQRGCISPCSSFATRRPAAPPPSGLRPLSAPPPPPPRPPTPSCPALSRVRPSSHRHPVHSPSFLMLGSYSRCAQRELSLSLSLFLFIALLVLSIALCVSRSFSLSLSPSPSLARSFEKKRRGLRSIFITQTGRPSGAHKKCLFTYGDWSATGFGGNAELLSLFLLPSRLPSAVGISFRHASSGSLPVLFVHSLALLYLFRPFLLFFQRGEKMRAARRLVEGTDDVVSDVPPPGFGGGDARETVVRGRAVECERRHRRVHISRGCCMPGRGRVTGRTSDRIGNIIIRTEFSRNLCAEEKGVAS